MTSRHYILHPFMYIIKGPWIEYALRTLLEHEIIIRFSYELLDGEYAVVLTFGKDTDNAFEQWPYTERHSLRTDLRSLLAEHELPTQPGPPSTRQQRFEAEDLYIQQNEDVDPLIVRALGLTIVAYGHHEQIYLGPMLQKLNEVSIPRSMNGSKPILKLLQDEGAANVSIRDGKEPSIVTLVEDYPVVQFLRTSLNIHVKN